MDRDQTNDRHFSLRNNLIGDGLAKAETLSTFCKWPTEALKRVKYWQVSPFSTDAVHILSKPVS
jgi:hypothetical protein